MNLTHESDIMVRKHFDAAIKQVDADRREIRFVASQELTDRDGDLIVVDGIDLTDFRRNPVLLANHDREFTLGRVTSLRVEDLPEGRALVGAAQILPAGTSARVDELYSAIRFGARAGMSIGFLPVLADLRSVEEGGGRIFHRIRLLEVSSVALPSCPTCMVTEKRWHARLPSSEVFDVDEHMLEGVLRETVVGTLVETAKEAVTAAIDAQRGRVA